VTDTKRAARILVPAYVAILLAVLAVGWLLTHPLQDSVEPRDNDVVQWFADHRNGSLDLLAAAGSHVADTWVGLALAVVIAAAFARWRRTWLPVVYFAVLMVGHHSLYVIATHVVPRDRPPVKILDPGLVPNHSFPSGHTATGVILYGGTALLLAWAVPRLRRWVWPLFLVVFVVAASRLYQGAHHPTDVLTGALYGAAWLAVVSHALLRDAPASTATPRAHA
jgi:membrane-associated phospholipid phosphatase